MVARVQADAAKSENDDTKPDPKSAKPKSAKQGDKIETSAANGSAIAQDDEKEDVPISMADYADLSFVSGTEEKEEDDYLSDLSELATLAAELEAKPDKSKPASSEAKPDKSKPANSEMKEEESGTQSKLAAGFS